MAATFSRLKNWVKEKLTYADLNAEIDNILTNFTPAGMDDFSANEAQMQQQTSPGTPGNPDLAESLGEEIERIRQVLADIKGETYWYSSADTNLQEVANALGGGLPTTRISSGKSRSGSSQLVALVPNGSAATVTLEGASTSFIAVIDGVQLTISSDVNLTGLQTAPSSNNTALVDYVGAFGDNDFTKTLGENNSVIPVDTVGSEITSLANDMAAYSITNGTDTEYFLGRYNTSGYIEDCWRGFAFDSSDNPVPSIGFSDNDTITLLKAAWIFLKNDSTLKVVYNEPTVSKDEPSSPAIGDYWFDIENKTWKLFDSASWVSADAVSIGVAILDNTNCVAARTWDQFVNTQEFNGNFGLTYMSSTQAKCTKIGHILNIFGSTVRFYNDAPVWDMATDLDSGITESSLSTYFLYLNENGDEIISDAEPRYFADRKGWYHRHQTWQCFGSVFNNGSSNIESVIDYTNKNRDNYDVIEHRTGGNSQQFYFHVNPDVEYTIAGQLGSDIENRRVRYYPHAMIAVIDQGGTLNHRSGYREACFIYMAIDGAAQNRVPNIAISSSLWSNGKLQTCYEQNSSADTGRLYWVHSSSGATIAIQPIARFDFDNATAGTWSSSPSRKELGFHFRFRNIRFASADSGSYSNTTATETAVTNMTVPMYFTGDYPVKIGFVGNTTGSALDIYNNGAGTTNPQFSIKYRRDSTAGTAYASFDFLFSTFATWFRTPPNGAEVIVPASAMAEGTANIITTIQRTSSSTAHRIAMTELRMYCEELCDLEPGEL